MGGQDELVFDGGSFVLGADHSLRAGLAVVDEVCSQMASGRRAWCDQGTLVSDSELLEATYRAMVLGLRDYVDKNRFGRHSRHVRRHNSALSAAVAVDALGSDRVHCAPCTTYTSQDSLDDPRNAADYLGARLDQVSIEPAMQAFTTMLTDQFEGTESDTTEENVQARSRGIT